MKNRIIFVSIAVVAAFCFFRLFAAEAKTSATQEYLTIRWAGKENIHLIRPGGTVEFIGGEVRRFPKPDRADERSFYMNVAMNGLTKEGYEFVAMTSEEIVMKRPVQ